jgi:hypothetical protein
VAPIPFHFLFQPNVPELIHYSMTDESVLSQTDCPVNPKEGWMSLAIQDPALLHLTLVFSAWSLGNLQGRSLTPVVMYHKAESVCWLNKNLLDSNLVAKDSTITAVAYLTGVEVLSNDTFPSFTLLIYCQSFMGNVLDIVSCTGVFRGSALQGGGVGDPEAEGAEA